MVDIRIVITVWSILTGEYRGGCRLYTCFDHHAQSSVARLDNPSSARTSSHNRVVASRAIEIRQHANTVSRPGLTGVLYRSLGSSNIIENDGRVSTWRKPMATRQTSIMALLNRIHFDRQLVLPNIKRDFVWKPDQIRMLMDSVMREYPFGSVVLWQTKHLEVAYREFATDYATGQRFATLIKQAGHPLEMVLDGQHRLQSLHLATRGSHDHRRLYFDVTSGPDTREADSDAAYRFEFWRDDQRNRPRRLVRVFDMIGRASRPYKDARFRIMIKEIGLKGNDADRAEKNVARLRRILYQNDLVPVDIIDEDARDAASVRSPNEILAIFERVNTGGTRLIRSDLLSSLDKSRWRGTS